MVCCSEFILRSLFLLCCLKSLNTVNAEGGYGQQLNSSYGVSSPLIAKLRSRIEHLDLGSYYTNDKQLARYIESSSYNVERAAALLRRTAQWRKQSGTNKILESSPPSFLVENFPYECTGYTDEGNPVFYTPIGKWNIRAVFKAGLGREIRKFMNRLLEEIRKSMEGRVNPKTGEPVDQAVLIENLDGYSLKNLLTIRNNQFLTILRYLRNIDRHYPFLFQKYIIMKAPLALQITWPAIRKSMPRLRKILNIYNRFSVRGSHELFHTVPKHAIPLELGGTYVSLVSPGKHLQMS